ncbi:MAG: hybrid sensor histidine kinase/response regulator [Steroidobacteraceae bacterium]
MFRTALAGDRRVVAITILGALVVATLAQLATSSRAAWPWCAACVGLSGARLALNGPPRSGSLARTAPIERRRWLAALLLASTVWGAGALLFLRDNPAADTLLTGIFLAVPGLSVPLLSAWRPALYAALIPALLPLLATLLGHPLLAGIAAAFLMVLERLTMAQNDSLALLLAMRFHNEDLVQQLRSQIDAAARANQEKTHFVASAAHDLRQPLHALGMFCATLEQRLLNAPEKPLVRNMMNAIESLEESFGAILDISRLDAGTVQTAPQSFPIRDVFRRLYQQFGGEAENRGLALRFRATRRIVRTDPMLLERVLANLVQNALRYTRHGGVLVAARRHSRGIALEVWDTGLGIPEDKKDMIFREFYQIDNPERDRGRGQGIGLAIVRRLCNLLDLPLELQSTLGRGSVFRVIVSPGDGSAIDSPVAEADTFPPRRTGTITVLLVDDDRSIRDATRELLVPMQVQVLTAATIAEAVTLARTSSEQIDLVISDWRLRGQENGIDAVNAVRAVAGQSTPAVLITGDTSPELLRFAHESGLAVLHKPLQPRQLVRLIKHLRR